MRMLRRLLFNPATCLVATVTLFFALRDAFGHPRSWYGALGCLALFAYGCGLIYLLHFIGSGWYGGIRRMAREKAWEHPVFRSALNCSGFLFHITYVSATILIFIVPPASLLSFMAAMAAVVTVASTAPLLRNPAAPVP